ncbi:MAG: hypothetical protein KR126chlam2_01415, partial [Chlamydiae bacterium]|nr:hypothetical protein [Chlamydiota bacterium]
PQLTVATFDPTFLKAPKEVLISEMVEHQKYFPMADKSGDLLPKFVIACNNTPSDQIRHGNQKALASRLADGRYLYEEDLKTPLEKWGEKLKTVTFQKELGSIAQKVERITANVELLHTHLPICDLEQAKRAALLCKADLTTGLVGEFPELQGSAGRIYALKQGEDPEIAQAIDEHWMPRGEKAPLPRSPIGVLLSIADKIDNLLSCFAIELIPTSSSDPYALRRQALGLIRMVIEGHHFLPLPTLLSAAYDRFIQNPSLHLKLNKETVLEPLFPFFTSRLRTVFHESGFEKDEIEAVLSRGLQDIYDSYRLVDAIHTFRNESRDKLSDILEFYTRTKKILLSQDPTLKPSWQRQTRASDHTTVNPDLFTDENEKYLFQKLEEVKKTFHESILDRRAPQKRDYPKAFALLAELKDPVSALFNNVMILDKNPEIKTNRLTLLQEVWDLAEELLDFSKLQGE